MAFKPLHTTWSPKQVKFAYISTINEAAARAGTSRVTSHK
jgi:hypothetical protein